MKYLEDNKFNILILLIVWVVSAILINPQGNFTFGDDFAYFKPVKHYLETGQIRITDWTSMTLVAHLYIGIFVSKIFGFSFTILRITTLFFGFAGILGIYYLALLISNNKKLSLLGAFLIGFNPSFYQISFTYYTDISFFAFIIFSLIFYLKYINSNRLFYILLAIFLNIIAFLIRDLAIIIPPAFLITYIYKRGYKLKNLSIALLPFIIIVVEFIIYRYWLKYEHGLTKNINFSRDKMLTVWTSGVGYFLLIYIKNLIYSTVFFGYFLFPVILILTINKFKIYSRKVKYLQILSTIFLIPVFIIIFQKIPKIYNSVSELTIGSQIFHPTIFPDALNPSKEYIYDFPYWLIIVVIIIALISGISIWFIVSNNVYYAVKQKIWKSKNNVHIFLLLTALTLIFYCIPTFSQIIVARYLYLPLAFMFFILIYNKEFFKVKIIYIKIIIAVWISYQLFTTVTSTHDLMANNRTKAQALEYLNNDLKIDPKLIDGGFDYNVWHFYKWDFPKTKAKNWWWVYDDKYVVSWGKISGYNILREYNYTRWLPPGFQGKIFVSQRKE